LHYTNHLLTDEDDYDCTNMRSFSWSMSSRAGKRHADNTITLRP